MDATRHAPSPVTVVVGFGLARRLKVPKRTKVAVLGERTPRRFRLSFKLPSALAQHHLPRPPQLSSLPLLAVQHASCRRYV